MTTLFIDSRPCSELVPSESTSVSSPGVGASSCAPTPGRFRQCPYCHCVRIREYSHTTRKLDSGVRVYVDEAGKQWRGARCPGCVAPVRKVQNARRRGSPIDASTDHCTHVGRKNERRVQGLLEGLGYTTQITRSKGPDLRVFMQGDWVSIEVKTASLMGRDCWYVSGVAPARRHDDLIAYVFPDSIYFEQMEAHLAALGSSGKRTVTPFKRAVA